MLKRWKQSLGSVEALEVFEIVCVGTTVMSKRVRAVGGANKSAKKSRKDGGSGSERDLLPDPQTMSREAKAMVPQYRNKNNTLLVHIYKCTFKSVQVHGRGKSIIQNIIMQNRQKNYYTPGRGKIVPRNIILHSWYRKNCAA